MTAIDSFLDELAPGEEWVASWDDVLARATFTPTRNGSRTPLSRRRVAVLAVAVVAIALIPLIAVAATNGWWFLRHPSPEMTPSKTPVVVKNGEFGGRQWELVAYPAPDGLCWSLTFTADAEKGSGAGLSCGPVVGFPSQHSNSEMTVTYLATSGDKSSPAWVIGPVSPAATTVKIRIGTTTITTEAFKAPASLGNLGFYATQIPSSVVLPFRPAPGKQPQPFVTWVAGYDSHGNVVACLNTRIMDQTGTSPISACP
jgi:hypothetical protein